MSPERVEAELQRISLSLRLSAGGVDPDEAYGWERARERRDRQGSYRELERALERLREQDQLGWEYLLWCYNPAVEATPGPREEALIALLASWLPERIKLPGHLARELSRRKHELIRALAKDELDEQDIADAALVSVSTVRKVLGKQREATKSLLTTTMSS